MNIEVGDQIVMKDKQYEVIKITGKTIWYRIPPYTMGQTIERFIDKVIKLNK